MKNHAGFKVGDKVQYIRTGAGCNPDLLNTRGIVKIAYDDRCEVKFTKEKGVTKTWCILNEHLTKVETGICTPPQLTPREKANDKDNVWEISIKPAPFNRERTVADLIVNGRIVDTITVSRWHNEDKYDVGTAVYEVVKKMFNIKDKGIEKVDDTVVKEPKWFNGKVVCTKGSLWFAKRQFTKGKIYNVVDGIIRDDTGAIYHGFKSVEEINRRMVSQFIEAVEKMDNTTTKEPEWFTGKIVCTYSDSGEFTEGKIYRVNHGVLFNNDNFKYGNFESVENINKRLYSQFIEVVE